MVVTSNPRIDIVFLFVITPSLRAEDWSLFFNLALKEALCIH